MWVEMMYPQREMKDIKNAHLWKVSLFVSVQGLGVGYGCGCVFTLRKEKRGIKHIRNCKCQTTMIC